MFTLTINITLAILTFVIEAALFGGVGFYYYRRDLRRARAQENLAFRQPLAGSAHKSLQLGSEAQ